MDHSSLRTRLRRKSVLRRGGVWSRILAGPPAGQDFAACRDLCARDLIKSALIHSTSIAEFASTVWAEAHATENQSRCGPKPTLRKINRTRASAHLSMSPTHDTTGRKWNDDPCRHPTCAGATVPWPHSENPFRQKRPAL